MKAEIIALAYDDHMHLILYLNETVVFFFSFYK